MDSTIDSQRRLRDDDDEPENTLQHVTMDMAVDRSLDMAAALVGLSKATVGRNSDGHSSTRRQPDRQSRKGRQHTVSDEWIEPGVTQQTLAAWRAQLVKIRGEERRRSHNLPAETGRLLEIVGQALAQGGGPLPPGDIARIEELTSVDATYR